MHPLNDEDKVRQFIVKRLAKQGRGKAAFGPDTKLVDRGLLDSFGVLELFAFLEDAFDVYFEKGELKPESVGSLNAILLLVRSKKTLKKHG